MAFKHLAYLLLIVKVVPTFSVLPVATKHRPYGAITKSEKNSRNYIDTLSKILPVEFSLDLRVNNPSVTEKDFVFK